MMKHYFILLADRPLQRAISRWQRAARTAAFGTYWELQGANNSVWRGTHAALNTKPSWVNNRTMSGF
jgi:hypothetical protein